MGSASGSTDGRQPQVTSQIVRRGAEMDLGVSEGRLELRACWHGPGRRREREATKRGAHPGDVGDIGVVVEKIEG